MKVIYRTSAALLLILSAYAADVTGDRLKIGSSHTLSGTLATIAGGLSNTNKAYYGTISGGTENMLDATSSTDNGSLFTTIGGGAANVIGTNSYRSTIGGGYGNFIHEDAWGSTISGGSDNEIEEDSYLGWIGGGLQSFIDASSAYAGIGGGGANYIGPNSPYAVILGGIVNTNNSSEAVIGGGRSNLIWPGSGNSIIAGGRTSTIYTNCAFAVISGGADNWINVSGQAVCATIGGGFGNTNSGNYSTIGGGVYNVIANERATVGGGQYNTASGFAATVPGGYGNTASGTESFAAGYHAKADDNGAFVWADSSSSTDVASTAANQFIVRASGGLWFGTTSSPSIPANHFLETSTGGYLTTGGAWTSSSDRNAKENFAEVDGREVLAKLTKMPIQTWNYKAEEPSIRHIGVMAQDFASAFSVGQDDRHITTIDADGVAMAAIKGLAQIVDEKNQKIEELESRLKAIEMAVKNHQN